MEVSTSIVFMNSNEQNVFILFSVIYPGTVCYILHACLLMTYLSVKIFWVKSLKGEEKPHENTLSMGLQESWLWLNIFNTGKLSFLRYDSYDSKTIFTCTFTIL